MNLLDRLREAVHSIEEESLLYALAGGLVASVYRNKPRATNDIDFVILTDLESKAKKILSTLHLQPHEMRKANLEGGPRFAIQKKNTPVYIVCGRSTDSNQHIGVDLILSNMPWAQIALERAQANRIDFGFGGIPCLTHEDMILSKLYAVQNQPTRFMDLDDLRSIFESKHKLDEIYIRDQMKHLKIKLPDVLKTIAPKSIC